jgi:hypothetical protein
MLQNERFGTDLKKFIPYVKIIDQSKTSDQYFRLFDVPEKLYLGKNSFRIRVNKDTLAKGALVYIDVVDANGGIIFHEVSQLIGEDGSRLIVIHIYENTPPGEATIYIASRAIYDVKNGTTLNYSNDASSTDFIDFPNIIWAGKVVVIPTAQTNNEVIFADAPKVKIRERFEQFLSNTGGGNRKVFNSGSWLVTIQPTITAYQYSDKSKFAPQLNETSANVILDPRVQGGQAESNQRLLPLYSELTVLKDEIGNFTQDYVGGEIIIRGLDSQITEPGIDVPDFSCSIVEVLDSQTVKVTPPFKFLYGDKESKLLSSIKNATNVTASYFSKTQQLTTKDSESFVQIELENIEPIAGAVDAVKLSYKPYGSFGEFIPIGEFKLPEQEFLIDSSSLILSKTELIERHIGKPSGSAEFDMYWDTTNGKYAVETQNSGSFTNQGVYFRSKGAPENDAIDYDYKFMPKSPYGIRAVANTEFKLSFYTNFTELRDEGVKGQIDIFISGSSVLRATINERTMDPPKNPLSDGTHISSIVEESEKSTDKHTIYFKTLTDGVIYPIFFVKNCSLLGVKEISITARNEAGFSPNQAKLFVPITTLKTDSEIVLNVEYLSKNKESSKIESKVYGLTFSGSGLTPSIVDTGLSGSPVFNAVSQSISVQTSGSSLYSTDPATSGFSDQYGIFLGVEAGKDANQAEASIFLGYQAGKQATNANNSNFIGQYCGYQATNSDVSNFIGYNVGSQAINADYSNFIGYNAGAYATNASFSNFVGSQAGEFATVSTLSNFIGNSSGRNAASASNSILIGTRAGAASILSKTIGSDNIVIGNGISLPVNSRYGLNIAGLIFGTGSYSTQTLDAFSGSANGRIGINQPNPKYSLDVSGSGNYTNNLHVTGGLLVTQSYISTVDYIDFTKDAVTPFAEGRISWDGDRKTLQVDTETNNFSISAGHVNVLRGRNTNAFTLTKGTVVYVNGNSGQFATFGTASWNNEVDSAYTIGIVAQDINTNQYGYAVIQGEITGINTNGFGPGTLLYLSSSGKYTSQVPVAPNHTVRLGQVVVASTNGILQVKIDNGYETGELHNVIESNIQTGDLLIYDSGSRVYRNSKILSGSYGVSGSLIVSEGITGSLFGTASYQSVKTSGSTLYSFDPSTSNFNKSESIFLGPSAGLNATSAYNSVFLGQSAGAGAASAYHSHFVGAYTGNGATNARYSIFMGYAVGENASSAYESIFIGNQAGKLAQNSNNSIYIGSSAGRVDSTSLSPGENNIVIGTGITVAQSEKNKVNIGALIFGSGSILNTSNPFSGSANGKVGINQPNPKYSFDVSGSGNYTNGLLVTSSFTVVTGSVSLPYTSSNANFDISSTDYVIELKGGNRANLPYASEKIGRVLIFKNTTNATYTIYPKSGETVESFDSSTGYSISSPSGSVTVISNGIAWMVI